MTSKSLRSSAERRGQTSRSVSTVFTLGMTAWWLAPARPRSWKGPPAEPAAEPGPAQRPDLRAGRAGTVAHPHPSPRAALPLLRQPGRAEGNRRRRPGPPSPRRRDRGRGARPGPRATAAAGGGGGHLAGGAGAGARRHRGRGTRGIGAPRPALGGAISGRAGPHRPAAGREVEVSLTGADVRLRVVGLASLVRDLGGVRGEAQRAA